MSGLRAFVVSTAMLAMAGSGFVLWNLISPGEEKRKEMLKNFPDCNPLRKEEMRTRNTLIMEALKEAAGTNENIARRKSGAAK